jgi:acetyl/propionyl-CoA carboxylase alpha subunit
LTSRETYLNIAQIIDAAKSMQVDAIHPGYGFLSERSEFAEACSEAGISFIGPSSSAMKKLGSKIEAKQLAQSLGIPLVPGFYEPNSKDEHLFQAAKKIGFPVLLKASAGAVEEVCGLCIMSLNLKRVLSSHQKKR